MDRLQKDFSEQLVYLRKKSLLSAPEVARRADIPYRTYKNYESEKSLPPYERLIKIVRVLRVTYDDIFRRFLKREKQEIQEILFRVHRVCENNEAMRILLNGLELLEIKIGMEAEETMGEGRGQQEKGA